MHRFFTFFIITFSLIFTSLSVQVFAQTPDEETPSIPENLVVTTVSASEIALDWDASTDNVEVTGYKVYKRSTSTGSDELVETLETETSYEDTGITPYTKFWYSVSALDAAGNESEKTPLRSGRTLAETTDTTAPSIPTNLSTSTPSSTEITLTWSASTDDTAVTGYKVYKRSTSGGADSLIATLGSILTYTDSGLNPYTKFWYSVSALDAAGNESSKSDLRSARTPAGDTDVTPPTTPGDFSVNSVSSSEFNLTWSASTDDTAVTGYKVYRRNTSGVESLIATLGTVNTYEDTGHSPNTKYWYAVSAIDAAGNESSKTALQSARTPLYDRGEADLSATTIGPNITVGIFNYTTTDLRNSALRIRASEPFAIFTRNGEKVMNIPADHDIRVKYNGNKEYLVYHADTNVTIGTVTQEVRFEAADPNAIFDISRPNSSFDRYRGDIKLRYYDSPVADGDRIWVINTIPLEHYTWGMGEITGTGADEYDRVMTTMFRTYGYWKIKWSTKWADLGFKVNATAGDQVYYGYDWEVSHPDIRDAAEATRGEIVMYQGQIALTAYSAWTDGNTRRYEDGHWGGSCESPTGTTSEVYPYLSSVPDPKGKHPTQGTCTLASNGNHMVGLSANGALRLASDSGWKAKSILSHYLSNIYIYNAY